LDQPSIQLHLSPSSAAITLATDATQVPCAIQLTRDSRDDNSSRHPSRSLASSAAATPQSTHSVCH
jgi:hypothetical protein